MFRWIGTALLALGLMVGTTVGMAMLTGVYPTGLSWILAVGFTKLALAGSLGLMAGGAMCLRLDRRAREREALLENPMSSGETKLPRA